MKIAFWSNANEKCNVSANLAAISVASVIRYPYSVIVIENRLREDGLGKAFIGRNQRNLSQEVGTNYYDGTGIEGLLRKIYRGNYSDDILKYHLKEIIDKHLYYIPQSRVIHNELFEYEFDHCIYPLFQMLGQYADICLIDTASHESLSTKTILEEADLIVVNLCQNKTILEDFFVNYSSMLAKAVFIISNYDCSEALSSKRIAAAYQISRDNIIAIPQNLFFQNAYSNGSVVAYISRNYSCVRENPNYIFIQAIKRATYTIIKKAEQTIKDKEMLMCGR